MQACSLLPPIGQTSSHKLPFTQHLPIPPPNISHYTSHSLPPTPFTPHISTSKVLHKIGFHRHKKGPLSTREHLTPGFTTQPRKLGPHNSLHTNNSINMAPATRATTSRAAKQKAQRRMKKLVYRDDEVSFPAINFDTSDDEGPPHLSQNDYDARESRMQQLEGELSTVWSEVRDINGKLDQLVEAATAHRHQPPHTPPRRGAVDRSTPKHVEYDTEERLPPPRALRRQQNWDGYVDSYSRRDQFDPPHHKGKHDSESNSGIRKPYMYIVRESCQTEKQKLDVRCELTALEYINAMVKLAMDSSAYDPRDQPHILSHLRDVSHDAMERPWNAVRRWSQAIFDAVERGDFCWYDRQDIQNERIRIAMTAPLSIANARKQGNASSNYSEFICREYNTKAGCRHRGEHTEGSVKLLHICAFCDAVYKQCTHSVYSCDRKIQYPSARLQRAQPHQFQQPRAVPEYNPYVPPPQPKNGQLAPQLY